MTQKKSLVEKVAGNLGTQLTVGAIAATLGTTAVFTVPLAGFLSILNNSLASSRYKARMAADFTELSQKLEGLTDKLNNYTDAQYGLTLKFTQTLIETIDAEKRRLLMTAILNIADSDFIGGFEEELFSRIIRDASAAEISFLAKYRDVEWFCFSSPRDDESTFYVEDPIDELRLRGLIGLGLVIRAPSEGLTTDKGSYRIAPFAPKLLDLLLKNKADCS